MYFDNRIKAQCLVSLEDQINYLLKKGISLTFSNVNNPNNYKKQIVDLLSSSFFSRISGEKGNDHETTTFNDTK